MNIHDTILHSGRCIALWDFGKGIRALNDPNLALTPRGNPVCEVNEGVLSEKSLRFAGGSWLEIPRSHIGPLNLHGDNSELTVIAWLKWEQAELYQAIAGVWNETEAKRQYCLFLNITSRYDSKENLHGHISHVGGPTPEHKFCISYATGAQKIPLQRWMMLAMTYDREYIRLYVDGALDANPRPNEFIPDCKTLNPFYYPGTLYDGKAEGSDFTVGGVHRSGEMGNWLHGALSGLAVFNECLSENTLQKLANFKQQQQGQQQ